MDRARIGKWEFKTLTSLPLPQANQKPFIPSNFSLKGAGRMKRRSRILQSLGFTFMLLGMTLVGGYLIPSLMTFASGVLFVLLGLIS
jgi:hypothetical protein